MSDITREEIAARIEASEARVETRLTSIDAKLDRVLDQVNNAMTASLRAEAAAESAKSAATATKWNILFTALGTIGVILAVGALVIAGMDFITGIARP